MQWTSVSRDQVADLVIAEAAFRALEADYHRGLLR